MKRSFGGAGLCCCGRVGLGLRLLSLKARRWAGVVFGRYCSHGLGMEESVLLLVLSRVRSVKLRLGERSGSDGDEACSEDESSSDELGGLSGASKVKSSRVLVRS